MLPGEGVSGGVPFGEMGLDFFGSRQHMLLIKLLGSPSLFMVYSAVSLCAILGTMLSTEDSFETRI